MKSNWSSCFLSFGRASSDNNRPDVSNSRFRIHGSRFTFTFAAFPSIIGLGRCYPTSFDKPPFDVKFHAEAAQFFERAAIDDFQRGKWRGFSNKNRNFMRRFSKLVRGFWPALVGGVAVFAVIQLTSLGRETNSPPQIKVDDTPIERETHGVTSYAPIVKRVAPSVVNIYSTRTVREREMNPFFNDPLFRRFFGPNDDQDQDQSQGNRHRRQPRTERSQSLGSGVIISADGYILTANHVVEGADEIKVALASGGQEFTAKVIGADAPTDVAVLKIAGKDLPIVTMADSDKLEVGDVVLAIGNPFGVGQTVTMGIVSAVG